MTEIATQYLGNITQSQTLAHQVREAKTKQKVLEVFLQESDRKKGRIHTKSTSGIAVGIIKSRHLQLQTGDVFQTTTEHLVLINLAVEQSLVLQLEQVTTESMMKLLRLGHLLGNHHYQIDIEGNKVYVRVISDSKVLLQMIEELQIQGLSVTWEELTSLEGMTPQTHFHRG